MGKKKKRDLWPLVKKYVHPETAVICTDEAGQYKKIDQLIKGVVHKTTNHSKGEFVDKKNKNNTINPLENENKHLKKAIVYRKTQKMLRQYMATHYYRRTRLDHMGKKNLGAQIWQFIQDVKEVYPGCLKSGLEMIQIDKVLPEDVGIERLMPNYKNDDDSEVTEWSDLEEDGMEDDVLDLDWEEITTPIIPWGMEGEGQNLLGEQPSRGGIEGGNTGNTPRHPSFPAREENYCT
ncbi:DDE_Tnp_IS1595 domain-containing protein [Caerostris extrusa]|uniref:DDE_Tnp_IS1595 domain-containing protein n=1 Tax=Caerostris extrusa TaxID=172846 RepID=A0AAV4TKT9_CAEEX|nr:DDE_Tnp_IS1595 domain-containing protein [Caerostris extrusa]